jgi:hypothetical protein
VQHLCLTETGLFLFPFEGAVTVQKLVDSVTLVDASQKATLVLNLEINASHHKISFKFRVFRKSEKERKKIE